MIAAWRRAAGFCSDLVRAHLGRSLPFKLTYIVTDECSCRCAVCSLWKEPRKGAPLADIERLFAANPHLSWINLSGGDVVERDDFTAIVAAALRSTRVYVVDFPTAGQEPERVERAVRALLATDLPRLLVTVSIDGPPAVHDRLRGREGAFARARETIERLLPLASRRFRPYVGLTFSSRNDARPRELVDELLAHLPAVPRERVHFNLAHHAPHYYRNRAGDVPDRERIADFLKEEAARRRPSWRDRSVHGLESMYWRLALGHLETGKSPLPCAALAASAFVDPDLRLYPCATWDRPLVDLREVGYSLARAVALADVRAAAADARALRCPNCWTPCEAFPAILTQLPRAAWRSVSAQPPRPRAEPLPHAR